MIHSKEDLAYYLEADRIALGKERKTPNLFTDEIWKYQILLRELEYQINIKGNRIIKKYYRYKLHKMSLHLGFAIQPNVFGPGLCIPHPGIIGIHGKVKVGKNCLIHDGVVIGTAAGSSDEVPTIGDNVYIGPGAKIFGKITIADDIAIGANAVVNRSFTEPGISIAGIPAKKISDRGSRGMMVRATDILDKRLGRKSVTH
jgi:serine O-acetyltransferase